MPPRTTGMDGKVLFESVPVGRYAVVLDTLASSELIHPSANPLAPPPQLTIAAADDTVSVEIEIWRGSLFSAQAAVDRGSVPPAKVILRSLDGQPGAELPLDGRGHGERLLLPGRWEAELQFPPGYLLADLVWNGESLPGHTARFDVREDPRPQNVTWYLSAPCLVTGLVTDPSGSCPVRVVATLVQPGPWIASALERGGTDFQVVANQEWPRQCVYRLWLPDGTWTVRPQGDDLLSSEPESADLVLSPGETRTLDFLLTLKEGEGRGSGEPLVVLVRAPDGRYLAGATVEVWPPGERDPSASPTRTGTTREFGGSVSFRGLAAGRYRVAAGRDDFLEGTAAVEEYDPKAPEPTHVTVTLREGARLHARALDEVGRPVQGVELSYSRLTPLPEMALASEAIAARKRSGTALSDVTGHVEIPGLYSGDYRIEARMTGEQSAIRFVLLRQGKDKHTKAIDAHLTEPERSDVDLLVLPAASLGGNLACSDRGTLPPKAAFRIFPAGSRVENLWREKELRSGAVAAPDDVVLRGSGSDRFQLGPLSPGSYILAARPIGQDYWSWASNELTPEAAAMLAVEEASTLDTGAVEIECGPLVAVVPEILSREPVPDLRLGTVRAVLSTAREGKGDREATPEIETNAERAFLRRLHEGKFRARVTVDHPYLIPPSLAAPEREVDLTRGKLVEIRMSFERLGGLVVVRGEGKAARLVSAEGRPVVQPVADGTALFPGTPAGTYRIEMCADPDCSTATASWDRVAVVAGKTTSLP